MSTIQAALKCTVTLDPGNVRRMMNQWKSAFPTLVAELTSPDYDMATQIMSEEAWATAMKCQQRADSSEQPAQKKTLTPHLKSPLF